MLIAACGNKKEGATTSPQGATPAADGAPTAAAETSAQIGGATQEGEPQAAVAAADSKATLGLRPQDLRTDGVIAEYTVVEDSNNDLSVRYKPTTYGIENFQEWADDVYRQLMLAASDGRVLNGDRREQQPYRAEGQKACRWTYVYNYGGSNVRVTLSNQGGDKGEVYEIHFKKQ